MKIRIVPSPSCRQTLSNLNGSMTVIASSENTLSGTKHSLGEAWRSLTRATHILVGGGVQVALLRVEPRGMNI